MMKLNTKQIFPPAPAVMPIQYVKPISYEFRVAETVDEHGKVMKVSLQIQIWEHDENGFGTVAQVWTDVPRHKFDNHGSMLPTF